MALRRGRLTLATKDSAPAAGIPTNAGLLEDGRMVTLNARSDGTFTIVTPETLAGRLVTLNTSTDRWVLR